MLFKIFNPSNRVSVKALVVPERDGKKRGQAVHLKLSDPNSARRYFKISLLAGLSLHVSRLGQG